MPFEQLQHDQPLHATQVRCQLTFQHTIKYAGINCFFPSGAAIVVTNDAIVGRRWGCLLYPHKVDNFFLSQLSELYTWRTVRYHHYSFLKQLWTLFYGI
jgi:hypothetical protein